ncbi:hypothetical protein ABHV46_10785 [Asaia sp. BMEF1]|uniref:hypothetical protein n=1 Tax=Asaia sp. BMEF1 TaxID=3155932 RepID=UPI003F678CE2
MVDWMDRGLQKKLLNLMAKYYPDPMFLREDCIGPEEKRLIIQNLRYLHDVGLCKLNRPESISDDTMIVQLRPTITSSGIDLLQDDGGLSAILNVVTVRFEADTLRGLIAAKIDASSEPEEKKAEAKKRLLGLKEEGLKAAVGKVVELGLGNIPTAASWFLSIT